jgi:dTDP-glucose 4,6-dehydratase
MKIFITGVTGFVGRNLAKKLLEDGHDVVGLARYVANRDESMFPHVKMFYGDIRDPDALLRILQLAEPEAIIHLAAQTSVEYSFTHQKEVYETNFLGTVNVVRAALEAIPSLERFIHASSVEVYGNQDFLPISEDCPLKPASPYGVAKVAAEYYLKYMVEGYGFPCVILRSANTYGRRYNHYFVVEHIIYDMLSGKEKVSMGDPAPIRDFLYITDEIDAYIKALETKKNVFGIPMGTGTDRGISIGDLFNTIKKLTGSIADPVWNVQSMRPFEIKDLVFDTSRIYQLLKWRHKTSLEDGLRMTIDWWRDYLG